jgi:translation initiation factor 1
VTDYSRLVYSTEGGAQRACPTCGRRIDRCVCGATRAARQPSGPKTPSVPNDGVVRVFRDRGGRKGKTVTLVTGVPPGRVDEVATQLKRAAAAGGVVRDGAIEIQGDHRDMFAARLGALGFRVKLAGG